MPKVNMNTNIAKQKFETFSYNTLQRTKEKKVINPLAFSNQLREMGDYFVNKEQKEDLNKYSRRFAETLVSQKSLELAGRVYFTVQRYNFFFILQNLNLYIHLHSVLYTRFHWLINWMQLLRLAHDIYVINLNFNHINHL